MKVKRLLVAVWCFVGIALTASLASATTITLTDENFHGTNVSNGQSQLSGTWNLTLDGDWGTYISPATSLAGWTIDSAQVVIAIENDGGSDQVEFFLDAKSLLKDLQAPLSWNQTWTSDVALVSGTLFGSISADGMLSYTVLWTGGSAFKVETAQLTVVATKQVTSPVPDGGITLAMLGLGMFGLGALRRKFGA